MKEPRIFGNQMLWRGRDVDTLTKTELIETLHDIVSLYEARLKRMREHQDLLDNASGNFMPSFLSSTTVPTKKTNLKDKEIDL